MPAPGGVTKPILILGYTGVQNAAALAVGGISQTVFSLEYARALSEAALRAGVAVRVHLKVDTGMGRIGFTADDDMERAVAEMAGGLCAAGACARGCLYAFRSGGQHRAGGYRLYAPPVRYFVRGSGGDGRPGLYLCGEALLQFGGYLRLPEFHLDMVRPGIILYGEQPSADTVLPGLVPALRLRAAVSMVKELAAGDAVSYGCTFRAPKPMRAATLAVGYADRLSAGAVGPGHGLAARQAGAGVGPGVYGPDRCGRDRPPDVKAGDAGYCVRRRLRRTA